MAFGTLSSDSSGRMTRDTGSGPAPVFLSSFSLFAGTWIYALSEQRYRDWLSWLSQRGFNCVRIWMNWHWGLSAGAAGRGVMPVPGNTYESSMDGYLSGAHQRANVWVPAEYDNGPYVYPCWDVMNPGWYNTANWGSNNTYNRRNPPDTFDSTKYSDAWGMSVSSDAHDVLIRCIEIADDYGMAVEVCSWRFVATESEYGWGPYAGVIGQSWPTNWYGKRVYTATGNYVEDATDSNGLTTWSETSGRNRWVNLLWESTLAYLANSSNWTGGVVRENWYLDLQNESNVAFSQGCDWGLSADLRAVKNKVVSKFSSSSWRPLCGASVAGLPPFGKNPMLYGVSDVNWWNEDAQGHRFWQYDHWQAYEGNIAARVAATFTNVDAPWTSHVPFGKGLGSVRWDKTEDKYRMCEWMVNKYCGKAAWGGAELDMFLYHGGYEWTPCLRGFQEANTINMLREAMDNMPYAPTGVSGYSLPLVMNETCRNERFWHANYRVAGATGGLDNGSSRWDLPHQQQFSMYLASRFAGAPSRGSAAGWCYHTDACFNPWKKDASPTDTADQATYIYLPSNMFFRGSLQALSQDVPADVDEFEAIASALYGFFYYPEEWRE